MLLRQGEVVASGLLESVMTGDNLSAAFGLPLKLEYAEGRFSARAA
jgi:iron complex transport system ATP-binding protein